MALDLRQLQLGLCRLITADPGEHQAVLARALFNRGIEEVVSGDDRLPAAARLEIYAEAYFERLRQILCEEYPATTRMIGEAEMSGLARAYLAAHSPSAPSVFHAGRLLPAFIRSNANPYPPYLADLATLERTLIEVFHAPDAPSLRPEDLRAVAPAQWPDLVLRAHPALALVALAHAVGEILRQLDAGQPPAPPDPRPCTLLIWRHSDVVYFRELSIAESAGLDATRESAPFAQVCAAIANAAPDVDAAAINAMLARWLADGLLLGSA